jgi:hypothetical protein
MTNTFVSLYSGRITISSNEHLPVSQRNTPPPPSTSKSLVVTAVTSNNTRGGLWISEDLSYVKFWGPQKLGSLKSLYTKETIKSRHERDVDERITPASVYKDQQYLHNRLTEILTHIFVFLRQQSHWWCLETIIREVCHFRCKWYQSRQPSPQHFCPQFTSSSNFFTARLKTSFLHRDTYNIYITNRSYVNGLHPLRKNELCEFRICSRVAPKNVT